MVADMKLFLTVVVYLMTLILVAVASFYAVLILAGPHGGLLPSSFETVVLVLGWLSVLVLPILPARWVRRRFNERRVSDSTVQHADKGGERPSS